MKWFSALLTLCLSLAPAARAADPVDLGGFLAFILPNDGFRDLKWDYLRDDPRIRWQSAGVISSVIKASRREGVIPLSVTTGVPEPRRESRPYTFWTIALRSVGDKKSGPTLITLEPGTSGGECLNAVDERCAFRPRDVLRSDRLRSKQVCGSKGADDQYEAYSVATEAKPASLVVFWTSMVEHKAFSRIEVHPVADRKTVCAIELATPKPRKPKPMPLPDYVIHRMPSDEDYSIVVQ